MYSSKLIIGDKYADGHGRHEVFNLIHDVTREELEEAYLLGSEIVGFDFANQCCSDYEESTIAEEEVQQLRDAGIDLSKVDEYDDTLQFYDENFVDVILQIIKLGNSETGVEIVPDSVIPSLNLGGRSSFGYGLYSN